MRVLHIEDNEQQAQRLRDAVEVGQSEDPIQIDHVRSRAEAERYLSEADWVDLVVSDLRIPAYEGGVDKRSEHGFAVATSAMARFPGTPVILLTGFAADNAQDIANVTSQGQVTDIFRDGEPLQMVELVGKDRLLDCAQRILRLGERVNSIEKTSISLSGGDSLGRAAIRAVGFAVRRWHGSAADVRMITSGLSGGTVLTCKVLDDASHTRASLLLKVHSRPRCEDEANRFADLVEGRLSHVAFPPLSEHWQELLGQQACLVYKFADEWDSSLFTYLSQDPGLDAVVAVRSLLGPWEAGETEETPLDGLRFRHIGRDEVATTLRSVGLFDDQIDQILTFKSGQNLTVSVQHGDLHGENVLCRPDGNSTLIDCGDIGLHPLGLDPITLELSVLFHPSSPFLAEHWPTQDQARSWRDIDEYTERCPISDFVRSCRLWATDVAGDEGVSATAYLYLLRQLKYNTVDPSLTASFLLGLTAT